MTDTIFLPVGDIAMIDELPYRPVDENYVKALVAAGEVEKWPPIIVTPGAYGDGCHYGLIAGQHRLLASMDLDRETIRAEIKPCANWLEMYLAMWDDNRTNGRAPSVAERKEHAVQLRKMYPDYSFREIGRLAGLDDKTVKHALAQAESASDEETDSEQREYNAGMKTPAQRLIAAFNKFVDEESNVFGSKHGGRNIERRARALARYVKANDESIIIFRSLASTFQQAAQFTEERLAAKTGIQKQVAGKK